MEHSSITCLAGIRRLTVHFLIVHGPSSIGGTCPRSILAVNAFVKPRVRHHISHRIWHKRRSRRPLNDTRRSMTGPRVHQHQSGLNLGWEELQEIYWSIACAIHIGPARLLEHKMRFPSKTIRTKRSPRCYAMEPSSQERHERFASSLKPCNAWMNGRDRFWFKRCCSGSAPRKGVICTEVQQRRLRNASRQRQSISVGFG